MRGRQLWLFLLGLLRITSTGSMGLGSSSALSKGWTRCPHWVLSCSLTTEPPFLSHGTQSRGICHHLLAALQRPGPPQVTSCAISWDVGVRKQKGTQQLRCDAPTSYHFTSGGHFPQNKGHGVDIHLLERLQVFQVHSGLQDLWCHVPGGAHLATERREALAGVCEEFSHRTWGWLGKAPPERAGGSYLPARCWQSHPR